MDDEIPEHGDPHASSSHEVSSEPIFKRREDLGKHSVYIHFPKDRNCEICQRTKMTRARAEDAIVELYLVLKILESSVTIANHETIIDTQSWCRI